MASETDLADQHVLVHHPVAGQGIERVLEGCRLVLLEEEMADPGKAITAQQRVQDPDGIHAADTHHQAADHQRGADEMQAATGLVGVFGQVVGIELGKAVKAFAAGSATNPKIVAPTKSAVITLVSFFVIVFIIIIVSKCNI